MNWHYSRKMPIGKILKMGAWEGGGFIGCVLFSSGASPQLHKAFGINRTEVCELVRLALAKHHAPVSRIAAISLKLLKARCPKLRLVISFADPEQEHVGTIYQAGNWIYLGESTAGLSYRMPDGTLTHNRNLAGPKGFGAGSPTSASQASYSRRLREGLESGAIKKVTTRPKFKYVYPLDSGMRQQLEAIKKPYPKAREAFAVDAPDFQLG
jgi:hypothetical protein